MSTIVCPVCGPVSGRALFQKKRRHFYQCRTCSVCLQWPLPTQAELAEYYDQEFAKGMYRTFTEAATMKERTAEYRLHKVLRWVEPTGKWLDVGCANGVFVATAARTGAVATGIELSSVAVEQAVQSGLNVRQARMEDLRENESYDCITAFDVIEHVLDPFAFLKSVAEHLEPDATCVLSLPDTSSIYAKMMGKNWWFYIPEEHLHYFSPKNFRQLADRVGLETIHIGRTFKPLTFDYGLTQFKEFNPWIYRILNTVSWIIPARLRRAIIPCYIGEMLVVLRKSGADTSQQTLYRSQCA